MRKMPVSPLLLYLTKHTTNMKRQSIFMLSLFSLLLLDSCSKDSSADNPEPTPDEKPIPVPDQNENVILSENTVLVTEKLTNHVTQPVVGSTIKFDLSIKQEDLPKVGQIILNSTLSKNFPKGFLGKVIKISKNENAYEVETEDASLCETFDKLYIHEIQDIVLDESSNKARTPLTLSSLQPYQYEDYRGLQFSKSKELSASISQDGWKNTNVSGSVEGKIGLNCGVGFKLECNIDIDKAKEKKYVAITLHSHSFQDVSLSLKGTATLETEYEFLKFPLIASKLPEGAVIQLILTPEIILSAFGSISGEFEVNKVLLHNDQDWILYFVQQKGENYAGIKKLSSGNNTPNTSSFILNGTLSGGLKIKASMKLFNQEYVTAEASLSAGPSISAQLPLTNNTENYYESFCDNTINTIWYVQGETSFNVSVFDKNGRDLSTSASVEFFKKEYHLFPAFENVKWHDASSTVSANVKNDLFIPANLNYALLDQNKTFQKLLLDQSIEYKSEKDLSTPLSATCQNLDPSKTYYIRPTIELPILGTIKALPEIKISPIEVLTIGALYYSEQQYLIMTGAFKVDEESKEPTQYGICYSTSNPNPTLSDIYIQAKMNDEGEFSTTLSNIAEEVTYYYRAYAVTNNKIIYGEVESIKIEKPDEDTYKKIVGTWEPIYYNLKAYVPEDSEEYEEIPEWNWETITFYSNGKYFILGYYNSWNLLSKTTLSTEIGDGDHVNYKIMKLTKNTLSLQVKYPGLYKMDVTFTRITE